MSETKGWRKNGGIFIDTMYIMPQLLCMICLQIIKEFKKNESIGLLWVLLTFSAMGQLIFAVRPDFLMWASLTEKQSFRWPNLAVQN